MNQRVKRYINKRITDEAQHHKCQSCGADDDTVVAAHSNQGRHGKGLGRKAHDIPAYLCAGCHRWLDQGSSSREMRNQMWMVAARKSFPLYRHLLCEVGMQHARDILGEETVDG